jgi:asparagine N-glycosylation enzyme membrane subunit Stt3
MDVLVSLRAALAGIMFLLIVLFFQFIKIKDLKSQRTILRGIFVGWSSLFIILIIVNPSLIYFIVLSGIAGIVNLIALFSLVDLIKEERNTLTDKEIYLLQQLANKK